jgi:hypothetical protein
MNIRDLIRRPKRLSNAGKWADGGARGMPKSAFPLSRSRSFQLGRKWRWRVDLLSVDEVEARLLTALEPGTERFLAWLSVRRGDEFAIVARYEFHGDHPGWHVHSQCGLVSGLKAAQIKPYGTRRVPAANKRHRRSGYGITETGAVAASFKVFRVISGDEDSFL